MDFLQEMIEQRQRLWEEQIQREERRIIQTFAREEKIKPNGMNSTIQAFQAAKTMNIQRQQVLVIANAATAAAIRKQFTQEEVEIIVTPAAETGMVYAVTDEELKSQLLASIKNRGVLKA